MTPEQRPEQRRRQDAAICEAFRNGTTRRRLVQEFGIARASIYRILREGGIAPAYTRTKMTPKQRWGRNAAICEAFRNGTTPTALAKEFDTKRGIICGILRRNGIIPSAKMRTELQERNKVIEEMHRYGLTAQDMAFESNLSLCTVYPILQSMGLPPNPPGKEQDSRNEAICEAFRNGSSRYEIAEQFKLSYNTILRVLKAGGLSMTDSQLAVRNADIRKAHQDGATIKELAPQFNLSIPRICEILGK